MRAQTTMQVRYRGCKIETLSERERHFVVPEQLRLKLGEAYDVHGISVYDTVVFLLIVDDLETPIFLPRALFEVSDASLPHDWICNTFAEGQVQLVIGPAFMAESLEAYNEMVDQRWNVVSRLWQRIEAAKSQSPDELP